MLTWGEEWEAEREDAETTLSVLVSLFLLTQHDLKRNETKPSGMWGRKMSYTVGSWSRAREENTSADDNLMALFSPHINI